MAGGIEDLTPEEAVEPEPMEPAAVTNESNAELLEVGSDEGEPIAPTAVDEGE